MEKRDKQTALMTGASSGIGAEFAKIFAREGYDLVLVSRTAERLEELKQQLENQHGIRVSALAVDLSEKNAARLVYDRVFEKSISIDVLVNNAGLGLHGPFFSEDVKREEEMMMVNMVALTQLTRLFLPPMLARNEGKILNVASIASFVPGPRMAVYFATKAYVLSFSESIADELRGTSLSVTTLCPGPTRTSFFKNTSREFFKKYDDPARVAECGYQSLIRGERIAVPDKKYEFLFFVARFLPRWVIVRIVARMMSSVD